MSKEGMRTAIAFGLMVMVYTVLFVHPVFAAGDFFSNFAGTLSDFLFHKIGKIMFLVFIVAGIVALGKSPAMAAIFFTVAILFAVGSGLASAIWDFFNSSSSASGNSGQVMYAVNLLISTV